MSGISFARGNTSVSGPGQNAFASFSAFAGQIFHAAFRHFNTGDVDDDRDCLPAGL